jgi:hypothetical protein
MNGLGTIGQRESGDTPNAEPKKPVDPDKLELERDDAERVDYKKNSTAVI